MGFVKNILQRLSVKRPTVFRDQKFNGYAAPLWFNPFPRCFLALAIPSFACLLTMIFQYVFSLTNEPSCGTSAHTFLIIYMVMLGIDIIFNISFYRIKVASDEEWSRYLSLIAVTVIMKSVIAAVGLIFLLSTLNKVSPACPHGADKSPLWTSTIIYTILIFTSYTLLARRESKEKTVV